MLGDQRIALDDDLLASRPALKSFEGRAVVLGIRPEHLEDASMHPDAGRDLRLRSVVDLREEMGNETHLYFSLSAAPVLTDDIRQLGYIAAIVAGPIARRYAARLSGPIASGSLGQLAKM